MGTRESLSNDFVFLYMPSKGINDSGSGPKLRKFFELAQQHNPINLGDATYGNMYSRKIEDIISNLKEDSKGLAIHAVFTNEEDAAGMLKDVKEADMGLSLVISGIFDKVQELCKKSGIHRHAATYSLGMWGKTEKLPPEPVLEVSTMCGHGMISAARILSAADDIKTGKKSAADAAKDLAKQCDCGIFNPARAAKLLAAMAE
jgi:hypothetical protein